MDLAPGWLISETVFTSRKKHQCIVRYRLLVDLLLYICFFQASIKKKRLEEQVRKQEEAYVWETVDLEKQRR